MIYFKCLFEYQKLLTLKFLEPVFEYTKIKIKGLFEPFRNQKLKLT
ncbi:hypothetical protein MATR_25030 [Marivirga tractuosa]|uniref:Uncharacterized protein n=1 Tax=Marivirga tractuosa (strain ATCC 23168 / DSM 4126 / NBRC 15989 / NCIMB 1408 / VKM B-1430 / H-43) TaxID=643867 RepID=E4TPV4_MARTH|nr:hypothetical protein Ftrac_3672 [Marivirga tractuosa DSM 4126]BDD15678.1 hypothetical protein MATR_25030 [Marivirga tractuosa]